MLSWQVGRVKITRIVEMDLPVPAQVIPQATAAELRWLPWLYPHFVGGDDDILKLSVHALLVETPGLKLLVDTCVGNDRPREITGGEPLATPFLQCLAEAGASRDGVDAVVCTHLHVDHVGWNTMLENGKWVPTSRGHATSSVGASMTSGAPMMTRNSKRCSAIASSRSSTPAWSNWLSWIR